LLRVEVSGESNVPDTGPVMLMSNHQSNLDPLLLGWATRRPVNMPGKIELFRIPVLRAYFTSLGAYPVNRDATDPGSLRRSIRVLKQGRVLAFFPEGTRTRTGELGQFDGTVVRLALAERAPIVPVGLSGVRDILPPGKHIPRVGAKLSIRFGPPEYLSEEFGRKPSAEALTVAAARIRSRVVELVNADSGT